MLGREFKLDWGDMGFEVGEFRVDCKAEGSVFAASGLRFVGFAVRGSFRV